LQNSPSKARGAAAGAPESQIGFVLQTRHDPPLPPSTEKIPPEMTAIIDSDGIFLPRDLAASSSHDPQPPVCASSKHLMFALPIRLSGGLAPNK
jgi:hypothetical protein